MLRLAPFWIFLIFFKFGGGLHYTMLAPLGSQVFPVWIVGILIGVSAFIQMLLDVPSGYMTDRFGYKKMLVVTTIFFVAASAVFLFGLTKATFLWSLAVSVIGWQFFSPGINAYAIGHSDDETVGKIISAKDVFASSGIVLASALVGFAVSWNVPLLGKILILIFIIACAAMLLAPADLAPKPEHHRKKLHPKFWKVAWKAAHDLKPVSYLLMITSFTASTFYAIIWFVVPLLIATQVHAHTLSLGLGVFDFSVVILGFFIGTLADKYDRKLLILLGIVIFAVAGILLGHNFGYAFILLGFVATAGDELSGVSLWAWLYALDKKHEHYGLITGMIELWSDLGWSVGPILAGILYVAVGPSWTIATGGIIILLNLGVYLFMVKHPLPHSLEKLPAFHLRHEKHKH
ncbi:MAG: hypothetical protein JWM20_936 [Patescibacteria group bacterium]|nr:hypothetical protein [Patescibacteria group bacterium]